jgi:hypothetical protein
MVCNGFYFKIPSNGTESIPTIGVGMLATEVKVKIKIEIEQNMNFIKSYFALKIWSFHVSSQKYPMA